MGMESLYGERDNAYSWYGGFGYIDMDRFDLCKSVNQPFCKRFFVDLDLFHANLLEILHSNTQTDSSGNMGSSRFVFLVAFCGCKVRPGNRFNHPASILNWLKHWFFHPEDAGTCRPEHLVT